MKHYLTFIASFLILLQGNAQSDSFDIIINNVSVIDAKQQLISPNRTIFVRDGKIVQIGNNDKLAGAAARTFIDGKGKFLSPGFWDMHVHVCWKENLNESVFPRFLSYGITGVRDMGGSLKILNAFKQKAKSNPASQPHLFGPGPILDGEVPVHPDFSIPLTSSNVKGVLDSLSRNGVDFYKLYSLLPKNILDTIRLYAELNKIPFVGHISEYIAPEDAIRNGQKSLEHLNRMVDLAADEKRLAEFVQLAKIYSTWICPTMIIYKRKQEILNGDFQYNEMYEGLDNDLKLEWELAKKKRLARVIDEEEKNSGKRQFETQKKLVKAFYDNGIPFLIGTDFAGMQFVYPGYSYHEEMELLSSMGISNFDIFKMATYNPTVFLGIDELCGTVAVNKLADLVLFSENPIENIRFSQSIELVIKSGKVFRHK